MANWKGTPVPNSGYVENVYFNTNLSVEEVENYLSKLSYIKTDFAENKVSPLLCSTQPNIIIFALVLGTGNHLICTAEDLTSGNYEIIYNSVNGFKIDVLNINNNLTSELLTIPIGTQNNLLSSLFSITPFVEVQEKVTLNSFLTGIADAIRSKKGTTDKINASNFASEIESIESGGSIDVDPTDSVAYYKAIRNKNYPYFPLPSEMEDEEDTIYMLYDATGYMCCPVFSVYFNNCVCTIQKYMNTELVNEYLDTNITSATYKYLQFSEEDNDYSTYNYIVIKLQGKITGILLNGNPKFNGITYPTDKYTELIEVSGKCKTCSTFRVSNSNSYKRHKNLKYFSFYGLNFYSVTYSEGIFLNCSALEVVPEFDTTNIPTVYSMFQGCSKLKSIPNFNLSNIKNISYTFYGCSSLEKIPNLDTSNITNVNRIFVGCSSLKEIPPLNLENCDGTNQMFENCVNLKKVNNLKLSNIYKTGSSTFNNCYNLVSIPEMNLENVTSTYSMFTNCYSLLDFNAYNMKINFDISKSTLLPKNVLIKILNNLATVETTQTLTLGSILLGKLTDEEKAIATAKGWTLA